MRVIMVVAIAENGVIGRDGGLPWRLSTDLARFKALTMGKPVVMGRKTFESIGRPLPGRVNIVVTRNAGWSASGVETAHSLADALRLAKTPAKAAGSDEICVIGGGQIYAEALPTADRLHVTHVLADVEGDVVFPEIDPDVWDKVHEKDVPAGPKDSHATRYAVYENRQGV